MVSRAGVATEELGGAAGKEVGEGRGDGGDEYSTPWLSTAMPTG